MAIGNALAGSAIKISVASKAAPTSFSPVGLMNSYDVNEADNNATFDTFDNDDGVTFSGKPRKTMSLAGYLADTDPGQALLLAASQGKTTVILKVLWDGTNGFTQEMRVNAYKATGRAAGATPIDVSFDFTGVTNMGTIVALGPLL